MLMAVLGLFGLLGAVLTLNSLGIITFESQAAENARTYSPAELVLFTNRPLKPGTTFGKDHVWSQKERWFNESPMALETIARSDFITEKTFQNFRGRVVATLKASGEPLKSSDFLPLGSAAGHQGLVPPGMHLVWLDESRVPGLKHLSYLSRFDLLTTFAADEDLAKSARESLEARGHVTPEERLKLATTKAPEERRILAQYGMVIETGVGTGKQKLTAVALHGDDIQLTKDAIHDDLNIDCVARARVPGDDPERIEQPEFDPSQQFIWVTEGVAEIEVIQGRVSTVDTTRRVVH
jgi:hypothetical protein